MSRLALIGLVLMVWSVAAAFVLVGVEALPTTWRAWLVLVFVGAPAFVVWELCREWLFEALPPFNENRRRRVKPVRVVVLLVVLAAALYATASAQRFLTIDDCLDDGGRWDAKRNACER